VELAVVRAFEAMQEGEGSGAVGKLFEGDGGEVGIGAGGVVHTDAVHLLFKNGG